MLLCRSGAGEYLFGGGEPTDARRWLVETLAEAVVFLMELLTTAEPGAAPDHGGARPACGSGKPDRPDRSQRSDARTNRARAVAFAVKNLTAKDGWKRYNSPYAVRVW